MGKKEFKPLSKAARPKNYKVKLHPDFETFKFSGHEVVDIEITRETKRIIVNSLEIEVTEAIFKNDEQAVKSCEIQYDTENEMVTFRFTNPLPVGPAQLELFFTGELNDKMKGFYRSKYTKPDGTESFIAVTQFEPTDARRAFPCWDEPAVKATFDISIVAPVDKVVLSNMDVLEETGYEEDNSLKVVSFKKTPIMSTYLVAFVVGDFEYIEGKSSDGIRLRVFTPLGKTEQGKFALEIAEKTLPFYSEYFGIPYPLPKMDLIAIPDFAAGAMENWGLVTYRETCLLVDPEHSSKSAMQWVALVVGHEIAHQWFGNLTTMVWWTDLWLNEGFASWIEYLCVDFCRPDFDIWTQFVVNDFTKALQLDGLANSHPIEVEVGHPSEIDEIFDAISYSKGASVIRMLHEYLGEDNFKAGLHSYLTKLQYKNGKTDDLWEHLENSSKKPVGRIMSTWTKQMGYPVISVSCEQTGASQKVLKLSQKKFTADGSEDANKSQWQVPITIATGNTGKKELSTLLSDPDMVIFMSDCTEDTWVKLNPGQVCFYRTNYSSEMLKSLIPAISSMTAVDRLGIQNDMFSLAAAGYSPTTNFLELLSGYSQEDNYTVWLDIDTNLSSIAIMMQNSNGMESFKSFVLKLYKPVAEKLGWEPKEGEDHLTSMLRGLILGRLGCYGDPETVEECRRRFKDHYEGSQLIPADLRVAVYSTVSVHGDIGTFDQLVQLYEGTDHMEEKVRIVRLIGAGQTEEIIQKALEYALSDKVRSADTVFSLAGCTRSLTGRRMTWAFVKERWAELYNRYDGGFLLSRLIKISTQNLATEDEAKDVEAFFEENKTPTAERVIKQSLESIVLNCKWLKRDADNINEWLSKQ